MTETWNDKNAYLANILESILIPGFFISDGELETVTGVERHEYAALLDKVYGAKEVYALDKFGDFALHAAITSIWGYPHQMNARLSDKLDVDITTKNACDVLQERCIMHRHRINS